MQVETTFTGFVDRAEGGRRLADALSLYRDNEQAVVIGLPRGGVVTAAAIAEKLHLPLDVLVVPENVEMERRERKYRTGRPPLDFTGKTVILVDDGLATGSTMAAAIEVVRRHDPARIVLAVPVASMEMLERFRFTVDELVYLETPEPFIAVGYWYIDFGPVSDEEVVRLLARSPKYPELVSAGVE